MSYSFYHNDLTDYRKFRQWIELGIFEKILQTVNQDAEMNLTLTKK